MQITKRKLISILLTSALLLSALAGCSSGGVSGGGGGGSSATPSDSAKAPGGANGSTAAPGEKTNTNGLISYDIGTEFAVFAIDVPAKLENDDLSVRTRVWTVDVEGSAIDKMWISSNDEYSFSLMGVLKDQSLDLHLNLLFTSMTEGTYDVKATSAKEYIENYSGLDPVIEECAIGAAQGYRVMQYGIDKTKINEIIYTFDGLTGEAGTWGCILIGTPAMDEFDTEPLFDDPVIKAILGSVHAPEKGGNAGSLPVRTETPAEPSYTIEVDSVTNTTTFYNVFIDTTPDWSNDDWRDNLFYVVDIIHDVQKQHHDSTDIEIAGEIRDRDIRVFLWGDIVPDELDLRDQNGEWWTLPI